MRRRCPIFCDETGLSPVNMSTDWLHTFSLGIFQNWLAVLINDLFKGNCYEIRSGPISSVRELNFNRFKEELSVWYYDEAQRGILHTKIQKLVLTMFGTPDHPKCDLYGGETNGLLAFSSVLLSRRGLCLGARRNIHIIAGDSLRLMLSLIRSHPYKFPDEAQVEFCQAVQKHVWAAQQLQVTYKPKHHFMREMGSRTPYDIELHW